MTEPKLTAHTADAKFSRVVRSERRITNIILKMILDFEDCKYHLELGYPTTFAWLTKRHGYDEGSANRRIQAARAMRAVPEVEQKLQEGKTTMSNLVRAQAIFRHEKNMTAEEKREVIESIEGQTTEQATRTLFEMFPESAAKINQDRKTPIDANHIRLSQNFTNDEDQLFERVKELLSHKMPNATTAEVMVYLAKEFIERNDPLKKKPRASKDVTVKRNPKPSSPAADPNEIDDLSTPKRKAQSDERPTEQNASTSKQRVTDATRVRIIRKAGSQCEYTDSKTGQRCESRIRLEIDHIRPRAQGGSNEEENLRCLCRAHNQYMSEQKLGKRHANRWRKARAQRR